MDDFKKDQDPNESSIVETKNNYIDNDDDDDEDDDDEDDEDYVPGAKDDNDNESDDQFNKKKPKMNILTKSLHDWNDFKASNSIEEELDQHNRSRGSYLERQAFLMRTDLREFEQEKSMRDRIRKLRDLNNL
ncbi:chromatin regulator yeti-like protein [Sarcoptes scabiei]|uniref:Craniofacial development protein 1 n=1 Tax=Sarcoptes scabiei TaxID=52283 RepID=A0A132ACN0_SARSC|nr:chromatin regulator yeti-like protein [Sarcoptes scabiei]